MAESISGLFFWDLLTFSRLHRLKLINETESLENEDFSKVFTLHYTGNCIREPKFDSNSNLFCFWIWLYLKITLLFLTGPLLRIVKKIHDHTYLPTVKTKLCPALLIASWASLCFNNEISCPSTENMISPAWRPAASPSDLKLTWKVQKIITYTYFNP